MTTGTLKTDIGPQMAQGAIPIPITLACAALVSSPIWLAIGWATGLIS
jgi:hypothetical protein